MNISLVPDYFDVKGVIELLSTVGATSLHMLPDEVRMDLLREAESYDYQPAEEVVGQGSRTVRQQLGFYDTFAGNSQFVRLRDAFQALLDNALEELDVYPFQTRLDLNDLVLQKYEEGSLGITPHRDHLTYINLVCLFVIGGRGRFFICDDRFGSNAREIEAPPGHVILMRAPGFRGSTGRPFHFLSDIQERRYSFGLRQKRHSG
ncbi:MAG: hypothetical protein PVH03_03805 [Chloroflexota bacterium]|jgi:hypothetical protein